MRWSGIIAFTCAFAGSACGSGGVTSRSQNVVSPDVPIAMPGPATLELTIPSVAVSRWRNEWIYRLRVLITETSGGNGAFIYSYYVGTGSEITPVADCDSSLTLYVGPGATLDLSGALDDAYCDPVGVSPEPLSSVIVTARFFDNQGRTGTVVGSIDVP